MMKIKKFGALLVSAVLCIGMAAPAFAYEGDTTPVEEPVLPEIVEEEDAVTITDEETGALTPWRGSAPAFLYAICSVVTPVLPQGVSYSHSWPSGSRFQGCPPPP